MNNTRLRAIGLDFCPFVLTVVLLLYTLKTNFLHYQDARYHSNFLAVIIVLPRYLCKGRHSITARKLFGGFWVVPCKTSWRLFDSDPRSTPFAGQTVGPGRAEAMGKVALFQDRDNILDQVFRHLKQVLPLPKHPPVKPSISRIWNCFFAKDLGP